MPENEVGEAVVALAHLHTYALPFPPRYVIPISFLQEVAEHNQLFDTIHHTLEQTDWQNGESVSSASQRIQQKIVRLVFPPTSIKALAYAYLSWWENHLVTLHPSFVHEIAAQPNIQSPPIKGEANIVESLLHLWSALYSSELLPVRYKEWQSGQHLPAAFFVEEAIPAHVSGSARGSQKSNIIEISARWGALGNDQNLVADYFEVDKRTWNITHRQIQQKTKEFVFEADSVVEKNVPSQKQHEQSLADKEVIEIAKFLSNTIQKTRLPLEITWVKTARKMYVIKVDAVEKREGDDSFSQPRSYNVMTKVFVAVGNAQHANEQITPHADGIGLLRSEFLFTKLGVHPLQLIRQKNQRLIVNAIVQEIRSFQQHIKPEQPIFYRSVDFTSQQLSHFSGGSEYETTEQNPFLGYRGAIRLLRTVEFLDLEVEALQQLQKSNQQLHFLIPFVRTPSEFMLLKKHIQQKLGSSISLWMECDTPENVLRIETYAAVGAAGFSINIQNVHALLHGISPEDPDIFSLYPIDLALMETMLRNVKEQLRSHGANVIVQMDEYHHDVTRVAVEQGFVGITVKPMVVEKAKREIRELESKQI